MKINALIASKADQPLRAGQVELRELQADDVKIEILYCGVCHSNLHMARNEWGVSRYPLVPGHEIVGRVVAVGGNVTKFAAGDTVGVGVMVDSCGECHFCQQQEEQYCEAGLRRPTTARINTPAIRHLVAMPSMSSPTSTLWSRCPTIWC